MTSKVTVCLKFTFSDQRGYLGIFLGILLGNLPVRQYFVLFTSIIYAASICVSTAIPVEIWIYTATSVEIWTCTATSVEIWMYTATSVEIWTCTATSPLLICDSP